MQEVEELNYKQLCKHVCVLAMEVGDYLREERLHSGTPTSESKGLHDFVTMFDKEAERRIVVRLQELMPDAGYIAEEGHGEHHGNEPFVWIIDPLDGTTNFIHRFAPTCVSIALQHQGRMVLGVVYEIWMQECFYAYDGGGAFLNGSPISVSSTAHVDDALLATGFPYTDFKFMSQYMKLLEWSMHHSHGVRRLGSAAADLAYVACGRVDGFFEYGLKPYDVAAGAYIVMQAGGCVTDFSRHDKWLHGGEIVASSAAIATELQQVVEQHMHAKKRLRDYMFTRK
ncbi:MAG: inositol monophosphatase [Bacteroidales bacterium]|nr:inositol monophosphatase [Bacteroidales bacterium]